MPGADSVSPAQRAGAGWIVSSKRSLSSLRIETRNNPGAAGADLDVGSLQGGHHSLVATAQAPDDAPGYRVHEQGQRLIVVPHDVDKLARRLETVGRFPAVQ